MICKKCKIEKQETDFPFKNKTLNKRNVVCKICQREYKNKHYHNNKKDHYRRNAITNKKLKDYANSIKSIGCNICDEKEISCMDFHHLRDKDDNIATILRRGSLKKLKEEISKCIVLCANCHRKVHAGILETGVV